MRCAANSHAVNSSVLAFCCCAASRLIDTAEPINAGLDSSSSMDGCAHEFTAGDAAVLALDSGSHPRADRRHGVVGAQAPIGPRRRLDGSPGKAGTDCTHSSHCTVTSPGCPWTTRSMRCATASQLHFDHDESDYNKREEMKRNGDLRLLHPEAL